MSGELVPFGKHKGKPVEVLLADAGYRDWVMGQPWFREKFPAIYQVIINYGAEPQDTPEHNQMQARFLEEAHCLALARLVWPDSLKLDEALQLAHAAAPYVATVVDHITEEHQQPRVAGRKFEEGGWDVVFCVAPPRVYFELVSSPPCTCVCDHGDCHENSSCRGGTDTWRCKHENHSHVAPPIDVLERFWRERRDISRLATEIGVHHDDCAWGGWVDNPWPYRNHHGRQTSAKSWLLHRWERLYGPDLTQRLLVECKPDLGDDFPAVLRQVLRRDAAAGEARCVIARRFEATTVSWEQVRTMFAESRVWLFAEQELVNDDAGDGRQERSDR